MKLLHAFDIDILFLYLVVRIESYSDLNTISSVFGLTNSNSKVLAKPSPRVNGALKSFAIGCGATEYVIPNYISCISDSAFSNCKTLQSITIPNCTTSIEDGAFFGCDSLTNVYCKAITPPRGGDYMFEYNATNRKIYVPRNSVDAYKSADGWKEYADDIVGYDF